MADMGDFSKRMSALGKTVQDNADKLTRKTALVIDSTVVLATPVDTGRARSNWIATIGTPTDQIREAYFPGKEKSTAGPNAQAAIDQAKAAITGYTAGKEIHITNNLDYIGSLNSGSSAQAPAAFVELAVAQASSTVQGVKVTVEGGVK